MKSFLNSLNGWQRLFVLLAIVWLPIFIATDSPLPVGFDAMPKPIRSAIATKAIDEALARKGFDPDAFLNRYSVDRKALALLENSSYLSANQSTKRFLFDNIVAVDPAFVSANEPTKEAILARFGIHATDDERRPSSDYFDDGLARKIAKEIGLIVPENPFAIYTREFWAVTPFVYRMDDGTEVTSYSQESAVRDAYKTVVIQLRSDYQKLVVTAVVGKTLGYLIPLVALYCLGALVGWVHKGFSRKST